MAEHRYYWLKFKDDFFDSKRIKKLRKMAGGDTYLIIYLKMQLKALKTDGVLQFTGVEQDFAEELALDLDESSDDVRVVLSYLLTYGLCECSDNIHYFLPYVLENTGSETATTQRVRDYRDRQRALHCNADETQVKRLCNADETDVKRTCNVEKEKEIEIEKDKRDKSKSVARFTPPTLEEVQQYASENNLKVDPQRFYTYFTTPNAKGETWVDSKGNKVRNWKQKMLTWDKAETAVKAGAAAQAKKRNTLLNYKVEGVGVPKLEDIAFDMSDFGEEL